MIKHRNITYNHSLLNLKKHLELLGILLWSVLTIAFYWIWTKLTNLKWKEWHFLLRNVNTSNFIKRQKEITRTCVPSGSNSHSFWEFSGLHTNWHLTDTGWSQLLERKLILKENWRIYRRYFSKLAIVTRQYGLGCISWVMLTESVYIRLGNTACAVEQQG